ncbi:MAG: hypothetical protein OEV66_08250 [Spirochaetia bacterium]|nr:hypothetical protein [Spirochaetia bacterium]
MKTMYIVFLGIHVSTAIFAGIYSILGFSLNQKFINSTDVKDQKKYNQKYLALTRIMIYISIIFAITGFSLAIRHYGFWILFKLALFSILVSLEILAGLKNLEIRDNELTGSGQFTNANKNLKLYAIGHLVVVCMLYAIAIIKPLK